MSGSAKTFNNAIEEALEKIDDVRSGMVDISLSMKKQNFKHCIRKQGHINIALTIPKTNSDF